MTGSEDQLQNSPDIGDIGDKVSSGIGVLLTILFAVAVSCIATYEEDDGEASASYYPTNSPNYKPRPKPKPGSSVTSVAAKIRVVARHLAGNKLGIKASDLRSKPNPRGQGTFVYCPRTRFSGVERKVIWLVLGNQAYPLNGATKGSVTPSLPWPRDVREETWKSTGLSSTSAFEANEIVFGI